MRELLAELARDRNPGDAWRALPEAYQADVQELVTLFASEMDPELWSSYVSTMAKLGAVIQEHGERIFDAAAGLTGEEMPPQQRARVREAWSATGELCTLLATSDVATLERLRAMDVGKFLDTTGARALAAWSRAAGILPFDPLGQVLGEPHEVSLLESTRDSAKVRVSSDGSPAREWELVRVGARWLPAGMARPWKEGLEEARRWIESRPWRLPDEDRQAFLESLREVGEVFDAVDRAQTEDEFALATTRFLTAVGTASQTLGGMIQGMSDRVAMAKVEKAKADIAAIDLAVAEYVIQNGGRWPESLVVLVTPDEEGYTYLTRRTVPLDPWKNEYRYDPPTAAEPRARVYTYGRDGRPGGEGEDADLDSWSL